MKCYLCGSKEDLTDDHVPAKTFFPKPRPDDMIYVSCCRTCHRPLSKEDEAFRTWAMSALTDNPSPKRLLAEGVLQRTIDRSAAMHQHMLQNIGQIPVVTSEGFSFVPSLNFPMERASHFLTRVTKAMLAKFHTDYDYSQDSFDVLHQWDLSAAQVAAIQELQRRSHYECRGDKVFEFWRSIAPDGGGWIFTFYQAVSFVVFHRHPAMNEGRSISEV